MYWVHLICKHEMRLKLFIIIFEAFKKYENKFFGYTKMNLKSLEPLTIKKNSITKNDTQFHNCVKPVSLIIIYRMRKLSQSYYHLQNEKDQYKTSYHSFVRLLPLF